MYIPTPNLQNLRQLIVRNIRETLPFGDKMLHDMHRIILQVTRVDRITGKQRVNNLRRTAKTKLLTEEVNYYQATHV